jgi:hypothetical protein
MVKRSKSLESAIGFFLIIVLLIIASIILINRSNANLDNFQVSLQQADNQSQGLQAFEQGPCPAGYKAFSKEEVYDSNNLYEEIDGKAPYYTESGFELLRTQRFVSEKDESLIMELYVYNMAIPLNSFSVYSTQRRADSQDVNSIGIAYKTANGIYFVIGKYYVELIGFSQSPQLLSDIETFAQEVKKNLSEGDNQNLVELKLLDFGGIIKSSPKLYITNGLGYNGFTNLFTASYEKSGQKLTAFLCKLANSQDAQTAAQTYYKYLIDNGGKAVKVADKSLEGKIIDFYGVIEIIFAVDNFVAGVHEADNQAAGEGLAIELMQRLKTGKN